MFGYKKKNNLFTANNAYMLLLVVILAIILILLGFVLFRKVLFPLILSAVWALILKLLKNTVRNVFFPDKK